MSEGHIISFRVFLDSRKVLDEAEVKLDGLHDKLERELQALR